MTTLGVMTSAERGSFLFDTTSLMNSANLTTSTWSLHFNCYTEGRVRSLRYLLQFYLLVEMTFSKGLHCLSLMSVNLTWNLGSLFTSKVRMKAQCTDLHLDVWAGPRRHAAPPGRAGSWMVQTLPSNVLVIFCSDPYPYLVFLLPTPAL